VDTFTHALSASLLFIAAGYPEYLPFGILGAIVPDIDFFFKFLSDRDPKLYIFTHGGITHTFSGALGLSLISLAVVYIVGVTRTGTVGTPVAGIFLIFCAIFMGYLFHLFLDYLAYPGIPLFFPVSDRKYTAGIFAGPSLFLMVVSTGFLVLFLTGVVTYPDIWAYAVIFTGFILFRVLLKIFMAMKFSGTTIPRFNPFSWLILERTGSSYELRRYLLPGKISGKKVYEKCSGVSCGIFRKCENLAEYRRLRYYSYFVVAERSGDTVRLSDPLREERIIFYPPYYSSLVIPLKHTGTGPDVSVD
jgi:inner membrane protein